MKSLNRLHNLHLTLCAIFLSTISSAPLALAKSKGAYVVPPESAKSQPLTGLTTGQPASAAKAAAVPNSQLAPGTPCLPGQTSEMCKALPAPASVSAPAGIVPAVEPTTPAAAIQAPAPVQIGKDTPVEPIGQTGTLQKSKKRGKSRRAPVGPAEN